MAKPTGYLDFSAPIRKEGRSTVTIKVFNASRHIYIGEIRWHQPWWQYSFFPCGQTIFNSGCLREIADRCERMTKQQREKRKIHD